MKRLINTLFLLSLGAFSTHAQVNAEAGKYILTLKGPVAEQRLVIRNFYADMTIQGTDGNQILIETEDYEGIPEKAKGLKPLSATGPENTGIGLSIVQEGNEIVISAASRNANDGDYMIHVPKDLKVRIDHNSWQGGDLTVENMTNEVEAKTQNGDMKFVNVTGPIIAHSLSSDIEVVFNTVNQSTPTSIVSTSGDVDITIPTTTKGNFMMSSVSGEVYTDLDFQFENDKDLKRFGGGMSAKAKLNGGGVAIDLKSVSGDVYVRKAE